MPRTSLWSAVFLPKLNFATYYTNRYNFCTYVSIKQNQTDGTKQNHHVGRSSPVPNKALGMSGYEYLQAMGEAKDSLPAHYAHVGYESRGTRKEESDFAFTPQEFHYNPIGSVHGGVITTILDSAMGCTLQSVLEAGTGYTTLELKVNFIKSVSTKNGELQATGKIIHAGSRTAAGGGPTHRRRRNRIRPRRQYLYDFEIWGITLLLMLNFE